MAKELHRRRRERLLEAIASSKHGKGMAIVPAATLKRRSNDVDYPFHQDPDFSYLTGYPEPGAVAVLRPDHDHPFTLFVLPHCPEAETWTGRRIGLDRAKEEYGADEAHPIDDLPSAVGDLFHGYEALFHKPGLQPELDRKIESQLQARRGRGREGAHVPTATVDLGSILHEHRLIKSPEEVEALRRAVEVTNQGHVAAMRALRPGLRESDVSAILEYVYRRNGAQGVAYENVVAAGANACVLHYTELQSLLRSEDLLLIDSGALVDGYSGDITRTLPVSGRFETAQKDVYQVVLEANRQAIEEVRPGAPFDAFHKAAVRILTDGLVSLGVLQGDLDDLIEKEAYKPYYMHRTGHWLGMDVHDVGRYFEKEKVARTLESGMALTVEPGLYLPEDDESVPAALRGIGVRIEDDVVVTDSGNEVLSAALPISPDEIEREMAETVDLPK